MVNKMENIGQFFLQKQVLAPILIIVISYVVGIILKKLLHAFFVRGKDHYQIKKSATIIELSGNVVKFFIYAIAIMMLLDVYGVDTKGILRSFGIAGVVLGLAVPTYVQDIMGGISIITENYYVIGDVIQIDDFVGEVIGLSLKSTKVKSPTNEVYVFANRNMSNVVNLSQKGAGIKIIVPTAYEEQTTKVEKVLKQIVEMAKKINDVYPTSSYLGVESLGDSAVGYSILIFCKPTEQWNIRRKVLKMIKETYDQNNLKIPYNQIEVHNGKEIV